MTTELDRALATIKRNANSQSKRVRDIAKKEQIAVNLRVAAILRDAAPDLYDGYAAQARASMLAETEARSARARASKRAGSAQSPITPSTSASLKAAPARTTEDPVYGETPSPAPASQTPSAAEQSDGWEIPITATQASLAPASASETPVDEKPATRPGQTTIGIADLNPFDMPVMPGASTGSIFEQPFNERARS